LMQHGTEARSGGVAIHDECGGEVWKVQDWCGGEGSLEVGEGSDTRLVWRLALLRSTYGGEWRGWFWCWRRRGAVAVLGQARRRERERVRTPGAQGCQADTIPGYSH
jgi:hypothetical protein